MRGIIEAPATLPPPTIGASGGDKGAAATASAGAPQPVITRSALARK